MARLELQKTGKEAIRKASRQAIGDYYDFLPSHERRTKWLRKGNPYRVKCVQQYRNELRTTSTATVNHEKLIEYVAASGPAHVIDGWSLISRAVQSLFQHDTYAAIHLGYYAELRAAMGLLACEGIGIFDDKHPVVVSSTHTISLPKGVRKHPRGNSSTHWIKTHAAVVPTLRYWSTLRRASDLIDKIVEPAGFPLSVWLDAFGAHARSRAVAKSWLAAWGLDLTQIETDHNARNLVSYRPSEFRKPSIAEIKQLATFVGELWFLFEPSSKYRFPNLELRLLRLALDNCGVSNIPASTIRDLGLTDGEAQTWAIALAKQDDLGPLSEANKNSQIESERCPLQVISRAALLLYLATGAARLHLANAGYTRDDLSFWWRSFGIERGLWKASAIPDDPRDGWIDVNEGLTDIQTLLEGAAPSCLNSWRAKLLTIDRTLDDFSGLELIAIWGLVP